MQAYTIPSKAVEGAKFVMGARLKNQGALTSSTLFVPGPGNYSPNFRAITPGEPQFSMKGRYAAAKRMQAPDPGAYGTSFADKGSAAKFSFGKSPQRPPITLTLSPGPGGNNIPGTVGQKASYVSAKF
jgi:hypothetical protein